MRGADARTRNRGCQWHMHQLCLSSIVHCRCRRVAGAWWRSWGHALASGWEAAGTMPPMCRPNRVAQVCPAAGAEEEEEHELEQAPALPWRLNWMWRRELQTLPVRQG